MCISCSDVFWRVKFSEITAFLTIEQAPQLKEGLVAVSMAIGSYKSEIRAAELRAGIGIGRYCCCTPVDRCIRFVINEHRIALVPGVIGRPPRWRWWPDAVQSGRNPLWYDMILHDGAALV